MCLQRFQSRLSGNWDTKTFELDSEKPDAGNTNGKSQEEFLRRSSVPSGPKGRIG